MNATMTTKPQSNSKATKRGFPGLRCPLCGSADVQRLDLDSLDTIHCAGCEEEYSLDTIRELMAMWGRLLTWIDAAPAIDE